MLERLASQYPEIRVADCAEADAIVVLSGTGPPRVGNERPWDSPNRMEAGIGLYRAGKAPRLIMVPNREEAAGLRASGVASVVLAGPARNTSGEARLIVAEARKHSWRKLILVTSGFHLGRALREFHKSARYDRTGLTLLPFPADPRIYERFPAPANSLSPGIAGLEFSTRAVREWFGQIGF